MYLREFSEPVIPPSSFQSFVEGYRLRASSLESTTATTSSVSSPSAAGDLSGNGPLGRKQKDLLQEHQFRKAVRELPEVNRHVLRLIIVFLRRLSENSPATLMDSDNLGKVFGPTLFRPPKDGGTGTAPGGGGGTAGKDHQTRVSNLISSFTAANTVGEITSYLITHSDILVLFLLLCSSPSSLVLVLILI
jgi:hypothetical protein